MKRAKALPALMLLVFSFQLSHAQQIKRQYQDDTYAETTVVIKDDKHTDDMELLNANFDLDDVAVGDVIRITTENIVPQEEQEAEPIVVEIPEQEATPAVINVPEPEAEPIAQVAQVEQKPQRRERASGGGIYPVKSGVFPGSLNRKRVKKKRKRVKRSRNGHCYRF